MTNQMKALILLTAIVCLSVLPLYNLFINDNSILEDDDDDDSIYDVKHKEKVMMISSSSSIQSVPTSAANDIVVSIAVAGDGSRSRDGDGDMKDSVSIDHIIHDMDKEVIVYINEGERDAVDVMNKQKENLENINDDVIVSESSKQHEEVIPIENDDVIVPESSKQHEEVIPIEKEDMPIEKYMNLRRPPKKKIIPIVDSVDSPNNIAGTVSSSSSLSSSSQSSTVETKWEAEEKLLLKYRKQFLSRHAHVAFRSPECPESNYVCDMGLLKPRRVDSSENSLKDEVTIDFRGKRSCSEFAGWSRNSMIKMMANHADRELNPSPLWVALVGDSILHGQMVAYAAQALQEPDPRRLESQFPQLKIDVETFHLSLLFCCVNGTDGKTCTLGRETIDFRSGGLEEEIIHVYTIGQRAKSQPWCISWHYLPNAGVVMEGRLERWLDMDILAPTAIVLNPGFNEIRQAGFQPDLIRMNWYGIINILDELAARRGSRIIYHTTAAIKTANWGNTFGAEKRVPRYNEIVGPLMKNHASIVDAYKISKEAFMTSQILKDGIHYHVFFYVVLNIIDMELVLRRKHTFCTNSKI